MFDRQTNNRVYERDPETKALKMTGNNIHIQNSQTARKSF